MSVKLACAAWNWHDLLFHLPTGKLKTFIFTTVLFCLLIYLWLNKENVKKKFYDNIFYSPLRELIYIWNCKILHYNILITVAKTCEKVLRCFRLKVEHVEEAKFSLLNEKSYNKTVIDFNFGRHYTIVDYWGIGHDEISTLEYQYWLRRSRGQYWYSQVDIISCPMPQ